MTHSRYEIAFRIIGMVASIFGDDVSTHYKIFEHKNLFRSIEWALYRIIFHMPFIKRFSENWLEIGWLEECINFTRRIHRKGYEKIEIIFLLWGDDVFLSFLEKFVCVEFRVSLHREWSPHLFLHVSLHVLCAHRRVWVSPVLTGTRESWHKEKVEHKKSHTSSW